MAISDDFGVDPAELEEVSVATDLRAAKDAEVRILADLAAHRYSEESIFAIKLALEEAITNAIKHGNKNDRSKRLVVKFVVDSRRVVIAVRDEGAGFAPESVPDPTATENLERPNGRGIMLMSAYMTRVLYNGEGNEVWMLKERDDTNVSPADKPVRRSG